MEALLILLAFPFIFLGSLISVALVFLVGVYIMSAIVSLGMVVAEKVRSRR